MPLGVLLVDQGVYEDAEDDENAACVHYDLLLDGQKAVVHGNLHFLQGRVVLIFRSDANVVAAHKATSKGKENKSVIS